MAKFSCNLKASASKTADYLNSGILNHAATVELVDSEVIKCGNDTVYLSVYDKYYVRNSSRTSLTVMITGNDVLCTVTAISSVGGSSAILNFSFGSEENFISVVEKLVSEYK